jgi:multidrug efflux pump subunit AcrA (membrane-fusion protein)
MRVYFGVDELSLSRYRQQYRKDEREYAWKGPAYVLAQAYGAPGVAPGSGFLGEASQVLAALRAPDVEPALKDLKIPIDVAIDGETGFPRRGYLDFADNKVNPSTGTKEVRGVLRNADRSLDTGMRARVRVPAGNPRKVLLITERAVGSEQGRKFVYVVGSDDVALRRDVTPGRLADGLLIIDAGLKPDEDIVVNGIQRVRDGMKVQPRRVPMPGAEQPAGAAPKKNGQ